ncbi:MAG: RNB domain-containing ribonuclease [Mollicutes bacterium]|jgi:exoribonuclease R|nr:RNB domain-containing ribonuclease [Mollicutes bacterium]
MLENRKLGLSNQLLEKIKKLIEENDNVEYKYLEEQIESYFPNFDLNKRSTIHCLLNEKPSVPEYKKPVQVAMRLDLRKSETISIDSTVIKENGNQIIFDDAFTLFKNGNGYMLYLHFADAPCYVFPNETLNEDLKNRLFSLHNGYDYIPLFNDDFAHNYLSLKPNIDRFAITIACEISSSGNIEGINFYESIIRNKKAFTSDEVNNILLGEPSNYTGLIEEYAKLLNLMTDKKDNIGQLIPDYFNVLAGILTAEYFKENDLPFIYRNCVPLKKVTKEEQKKMFNDFVSRRIGESYLDGIKEEVNHLVRVYYDVVNAGHSGLNVKAYGEVSKPLRNYVAISTLNGIKKMIIKRAINQKLIEEFYKEYQDLAVRANAIESVLQKR